MPVLIRLASALNVRPDEVRLVALLLLHSFFVGVNRVFILAVSTSAFLTEFDAATLPYVYIFTALANSLFGILYGALSRRLSFTRLLVVNLAIQLIAVLGFWLIFNLTTAQWPALVFMILVELLWLLTSLEFWPLAARIFTLQQGKRLFGLIGIGDTVAAMIGGFAVPTLVIFMGTYNLLLLAAGGSAASLLIIVAITRQFRARIEAIDSSSPHETTYGSQSAPRRTRYVTLIFAVTAIGTIAYYFLDNAFYGLTELQYTDSEMLAGFFGIYFAVVALVQLTAQSFLSAWMVNRFGVITCIVLPPLIVTIMTGLAALSGLIAGAAAITFVLMAIVRLVDYILRASLSNSTTMTIYQSLPPLLRVQTQTRVEGLIEPLMTGLAGVLLLLIVDVLGLSSVDVIVLSVVVLLLWTLFSFLLSREYPKALVLALSKRRLGKDKFTLQGQAVVSFIQARLAGSSAAESLYMLNLLGETDLQALKIMLPGLLNHNDAAVRVEVLRYIAQFRLKSTSPVVESLFLTDASSDVRAAALHTMVTLKPESAASRAVPALNAPESPVRRAAIVSLMEVGGDTARRAEQSLLTLLDAQEPEQRSLAAHILGELGDSDFYRLLLRLLHDDNLDVRRAALMAAHNLADSRLWPSVIENLAVKKVRSDAFAALSSADTSVFPLFAQVLDEARHEIESGFSARVPLARLVTRLCGRLGAVSVLVEHIDFPDAAVRDQALSALANNRYQTPEKSVIEERIVQEICDNLWYLQGWTLLAADDLVAAALTQIVSQTRRRLFWLAACIYDSQIMLRALNDYFADSEEQRSYALEVLHIHLSRDLKPLVITFLDDGQLRRNLGDLMTACGQEFLERDEWVRQLLNDSGTLVWLKVCTLYGIGRRGAVDLLPLVESVLTDNRIVVRETAEWVIEQLHGRSSGGKKMLLTVEKVLLLKSVSLFSHIPDTLLLEIASIVQDEHVQEGETIIYKDDLGDCMYVIVDGRVRVHDGDRTFAQLNNADVFGELALLDAEPRAASVTAMDETYLLRLNQETFYELIADYPEVLRGIIRVLSQRLRESNRRGMSLPENQPALA